MEDDGLVEAVSEDGRSLGWLRTIDCEAMGLPVRMIEPSPRYLDDPYVVYHSEILYERGSLTTGADLHPVQTALLMSAVVRRRRVGARQREDDLLNSMLINNQPMFEAWKRMREREELAQVEAEWTENAPPGSMSDLMADLAEFSDAGSGEPAEGIRAVLDDEEIGQLKGDPRWS